MGFDFTQLGGGIEGGGDAALQAAAQGVGEFAEVVFGHSQEYVPVSPTDPKHPYYTGTSGALQDSGAVKEVEVKDGSIECEIAYNAIYAAAVHERLEAEHQYPGHVKPDAQAKYLERPLREDTPKFGPYIADKMKGAIGG